MSTATLNRPGALSAGAVRPSRGHKPWGVYGRISRKRSKGDGAYATVTIPRQHEIGVGYVRSVDPSALTVVTYAEWGAHPDADIVLFEDNLSAYKPGVYREGFETMMQCVREGRLRGIAAVHVDRFVRSVLDQEIMWRDCQNSRPRTQLHVAVLGRVTDPMQLQMLAVQAEAESRIKSQRARNHHKDLAARGKNPGGKKWFGYDYVDKQRVVIPAEAAVIQELARRVLSGESLSSLAREMESRGVPTARGGKWTPSTVGQLLRGPQLAGIRTHTHEDPETGETVSTETDAEWEAILERGQWEAVVHLLTRPDRLKHSGTARVYLLSGVATCGAEGCGAVIRGSKRRGKVPGYACSTGRHCLRPVDLVDEVVKAEMVTRLSLVDAAGALVDDGAAVSVTELEAAVKLTAEAFDRDAASHAAGDMSDRVWGATAAAFDRRMTELEDALKDARAAAKAPERVLAGMVHPGDVDAARAAWEGATDDRRREVIRFLSTVQIFSAGRNRHAPFDPEQAVRVDFTPRG